MGHRDDFYTVDNIIGYTGKVHENPTVYFRKGDEYGHITQKHGIPQNEGRGPVREHSDYRIDNRDVKGEQKCVEYADGKVFHISRNVFIARDAVSEDQLRILALSITNHTELKKWATMSRKEKDDAIAAYKESLKDD
ncbi:MAG: hypothetical protein AAFY59_01515 [Pseudomonadota bacterium]